MENTLTQNYYTALRKRYEAQIEEAKANLSLYFSSKNLAAIGEHSDLLAEHDRWIDVMTTANDKLATLDSIFDLKTMRIKI